MPPLSVAISRLRFAICLWACCSFCCELSAFFSFLLLAFAIATCRSAKDLDGPPALALSPPWHLPLATLQSMQWVRVALLTNLPPSRPLQRQQYQSCIPCCPIGSDLRTPTELLWWPMRRSAALCRAAGLTAKLSLCAASWPRSRCLPRRWLRCHAGSVLTQLSKSP